MDTGTYGTGGGYGGTTTTTIGGYGPSSTTTHHHTSATAYSTHGTHSTQPSHVHHQHMDFQGQLGMFLEQGTSLYEALTGSYNSYTTQGGYYDVQGRPRPYYSSSTTTSSSTTRAKRPPIYGFVAMQAEIRTLEFWRSVIAESVATFFYTALICSVNTSSTLHTIQTNVAMASGFSIAVLTACFASISDCHANPSMTIARTFTRHISPLRSLLYICAQCGGAIAGAALVYGVYSRIQDPILEMSGGAFGMEFVLSFFIAYAFYASRAGHKADPVLIGLAYAGALVAWKGSLNPARALGSVFVSKEEGRFAKHWIFWIGPFLGALTGAFTFEYIFNPRRKKTTTLAPSSYTNMNTTNLIPYSTTAPTTVITNKIDDLHPTTTTHHPATFTEEDMIDDLERAKQYKATSMIDYGDSSAYNRSVYKRNPPYPESMYSGSKSLYNQTGTSGYDSKGVYGELGSKSCYEGYESGVIDRDISSLRRGTNRGMGMSSTAVNGNNNNNRNLSTTGGVSSGARRNPYDYLPEEPPGSNKPDIISGRKISNRNYSPTKYEDNSLRINDNFDKLDTTNANPPYRSGTTPGTGKTNDIYNDSANYNDPLKRQAPPAAPVMVDNSNYGTRTAGDYQRMGGGGGGSSRHRGDFYSPSYNASYSQQNGCSISQTAYNNY
uniref:Aquaporin n=1 Tax=Lepeophtheirus salmonis TaxID=72036 RepID=A0A0K2ULT0_LEPSM